jgi:hypothetical protein
MRSFWSGTFRVRQLCSDARIGAGFLGDERDGFAPEAHSATNVQEKPALEAGFFVVAVSGID